MTSYEKLSTNLPFDWLSVTSSRSSLVHSKMWSFDVLLKLEMLIPTNHNLDDITYNQWDSKLSFNFVDNFLKEQLPWERGGRWRTKHSIYFSIWFSLKIIFPFLLLLFFHFNRFIISKSTKYLFFTLKVKKSRTFFFFFFLKCHLDVLGSHATTIGEHWLQIGKNNKISKRI